MESTSSNLDGHKRCTKCSHVKPLLAFALKKGAPDGRQWACRTCQSDARRQSYARTFGDDDRAPEFVECIVCGQPAACDLDNPLWLNQFSDALPRHCALCSDRCHEALIDALVRMENLLSFGAKNAA